MFPTIPIQIQRIRPEAIVPRYAHPGDRGMDVFTTTGAAIRPGGRALLGIGWAIAVPLGYEIQIRPRSGLASHEGLTVLNSPGTIDEYRGEIRVLLINTGADMVRVEPGDAIAQLVVAPVFKGRLVEVEELPPSERGDQCFGSTSKASGHEWKAGDFLRADDGDIGLVTDCDNRFAFVQWLDSDPECISWVDMKRASPVPVHEVSRLLHPGPLEFEEFGNG